MVDVWVYYMKGCNIFFDDVNCWMQFVVINENGEV